jgi:hypothetical protein
MPRPRIVLTQARRLAAPVLLGAFLLVSGGCGGRMETAPSTTGAAPSYDAVPAETAPAAAGWSDAAYEACGPALREALATRDHAAEALASARSDEDEQAVSLSADARAGLDDGDARLEALRPALESGACDDALAAELALVRAAYTHAALDADEAVRIVGVRAAN